MSTGKTGPAPETTPSLTRVQTQVHNYFKIDEAGGGVTCSIALMTALLYPDNSKLCRYSQAVGFLTEEFLPAFEAIDLLRPDGHDVISICAWGGSPTTYSRHRTTRKRRKTPGHAYLKTHRKRTPTVVYVRLDQVILRSVTGIPKGPFFPTFPSHRHTTTLHIQPLAASFQPRNSPEKAQVHRARAARTERSRCCDGQETQE